MINMKSHNIRLRDVIKEKEFGVFEEDDLSKGVFLEEPWQTQSDKEDYEEWMDKINIYFEGCFDCDLYRDDNEQEKSIMFFIDQSLYLFLTNPRWRKFE